MATFVQLDQSPLDEQDSWSAPQAAKKNKKGKIIVAGAGLEDFVDWVDPNASSPTEEMEDNMSSLADGFTARMRKWTTSA